MDMLVNISVRIFTTGLRTVNGRHLQDSIDHINFYYSRGISLTDCVLVDIFVPIL